MQPVIKHIPSKKLAGHGISMSLVANKTHLLFSGFIPKRAQLKNAVGNDIFCVKVYPACYFRNFNPGTTFEKWALIEVSDASDLPEGMQAFTLPEGLYAIFHYKGPNTDHSIFDYIFREWLPNSEYVLDDRPHVDVLGSKYKNNDPDSEEDLYIPIKKKN